jgi:hypothetical protein
MVLKDVDINSRVVQKFGRSGFDDFEKVQFRVGTPLKRLVALAWPVTPEAAP